MAFQNRSCTIFVGNIPYDADEDQLKELFGRAGPVESLRLVYDKETRQPKGYGFCDFADPDSAVKAIKELSDLDINGRRLRLDLADNALRAGKGASKGPLALGDASRAAPPPQTSLPSSGMAPNRPAGELPAGSLPPDIEAKLRAAKNEPSPEAVASEVSAHTETAQIVSSMPKVQLQLCLGAMQRLAEEDPESSRALLQEHPQLCYALLHAQMLLGFDEEPLLPPDIDEVQQLRMQAAQRPGALPNMFGPRPIMPLLGLPGLSIPGMPGAGLGGLPVPSMPFAAIPRPPPPMPVGTAGFAKAPAAFPTASQLPAPVQPGLVSPMDVG
jgi:cleavage stimulation factor subunit 2